MDFNARLSIGSSFLWHIRACAAPSGSTTRLNPRGCAIEAAADWLFLLRVDLDQAVQELAALEQRLDADVLVEAVDVAEVRPEEHRLEAVGRDPDRIRELPVRRARLQDRQDRQPRPELG